MAQSESALWEPSGNAPSRADRRGGPFETYLPDPLCGRPLRLEADVSALSYRVEQSVRRLGAVPGSRGLEGLARFLLRSEAIASSRIEGLEVSPQQVGLAELADEEQLSAEAVNRTARKVAANITALRRATEELAALADVTVDAVEGLQAALLDDEPHLHGLRSVQNWIGGSDHTPIGAEFVPPAPHHVPALMGDLVTYLSTGDHAPLVQAALLHAHFETIHPFRDGNGRVGRALLHTVLVRRGLVRRALLPISPVLLTRSAEYVDGLTAYRYLGSPDSPAAAAGTSAWVRTFLQAVSVAVDQARAFADELDGLRAQWETAVAETRKEQGLRAVPRSDSASSRILDSLPEHPVLTTSSVVRHFTVSRPAASAALEELTAAGVLSSRRVGRGTRAYLAMDVFELITFAERRLASTRWDTQASDPARAVPYKP